MSNGATAAVVQQQKQAEQLDSVFFLLLTIEGRNKKITEQGYNASIVRDLAINMPFIEKWSIATAGTSGRSLGQNRHTRK